MQGFTLNDVPLSELDDEVMVLFNLNSNLALCPRRRSRGTMSMRLLLQDAEGAVVVDLFPLELGDSDIIFIVLGVVALGGLIVGLILIMMRRSSVMSDEISKQSRAKFEAIKPAGTNGSIAPTLVERPQARVALESTHLLQREREANIDYALRKEIFEIKFRLDKLIRDVAPSLEKQNQTRVDLDKVVTDIVALRDQLRVDGQDLRKLKLSLAELSFRLNSQRQDVENQRADLAKLRAQPELDKLRTEIAGFKDGLLTTEQEIQKLKAIDERSVNIQKAQGSATQRVDTPNITPATQVETLPKQQKPAIPHLHSTDFVSRTCIRCGLPTNPQDNYCVHCGQPVF
jgi:hypothetical protein